MLRPMLRPVILPLSLVGALVALTACADAVRTLRGASDQFDGAWVGQFQVSSRTRACTLSRGGIRAAINGGVIEATIRQAGGVASFDGFILESGEVASGLIDGEFDKDDAEVTGSFRDANGAGRWRSEECDGTWELRRIR